MSAAPVVTAVVGTYRRGGIIDQAVEEVLAAARREGATVRTVNLLDREIEFCRNCRHCTQEPGEERGRCVISDDMGDILDTLDRSDAIILASPTNFGTVTALMKRFMERLVCYAFWPWGQPGPQQRRKPRGVPALIVTSSAAPGFLARLVFPIVGVLKQAAATLGARPIGVLHVGLAARTPDQLLGAGTRRAAAHYGRRLARGRPA